MGVERYGSKTDVVVKLVLVFFIALLSFSVGTFVGKKFSDNQHKLAQLEPHQKSESEAIDTESEHTASAEAAGEHGERNIASANEAGAETKPQKSLSDDEIAKLAEEFVTDDSKPNAKGEANHGESAHHESAASESPHKETAKAEEGHTETAPAQTHKATAPSAEEHTAMKPEAAKTMESHPSKPLAEESSRQPSKPAARMAEGQSPIVENPPTPSSRIPAALPKEVASSAIGKFTVQVASFPKEKEAQALSASLKEQGFSAFYVSAKVKNDTYYRVSIGLFTTSKEAESYMKDLLKRKKVDSAIVQKIISAD